MQGGDRPSAFGNSRVGRIDGWSPVLRHHRIPLIDRLPVTHHEKQWFRGLAVSLFRFKQHLGTSAGRNSASGSGRVRVCRRRLRWHPTCRTRLANSGCGRQADAGQSNARRRAPTHCVRMAPAAKREPDAERCVAVVDADGVVAVLARARMASHGEQSGTWSRVCGVRWQTCACRVQRPCDY